MKQLNLSCSMRLCFPSAAVLYPLMAAAPAISPAHRQLNSNEQKEWKGGWKLKMLVIRKTREASMDACYSSLELVAPPSIARSEIKKYNATRRGF